MPTLTGDQDEQSISRDLGRKLRDFRGRFEISNCHLHGSCAVINIDRQMSLGGPAVCQLLKVIARRRHRLHGRKNETLTVWATRYRERNADTWLLPRKDSASDVWGQLRAAGARESEIRSAESVPREPEHRAGDRLTKSQIGRSTIEDCCRLVNVRLVN